MTLLLQSVFERADCTSQWKCDKKNSDVASEKPPGGQRARCDACASGRTLRRQSGSSWRSSTMKLSQTATEPPVPLHPAQLQPKTQPDRGRFKACAASEAHRAIVSRPRQHVPTVTVLRVCVHVCIFKVELIEIASCLDF